ncbi:MAG: imidazolonepropionase [Tepidisphaera sp.]|nr:imidazolonepropionase [Tepidisphaera sp.]
MNTLIHNAKVVTPKAPLGRGSAFGALTIMPGMDVEISNGLIAAIRPTDVTSKSPPSGYDDVVNAHGCVLLPGFVDCHTHACWVGDRLDEWEQKLRGVPYLDILAKGGGIMSTVRAVRQSPAQSLMGHLLWRIAEMQRTGTTAAEVKSGYGLSTHEELKMLRAIRGAASKWPGTLRMTALLGHAIDPDIPDFVERTIRETLPAVHAEFPDVTIDAFLEHGAWSLDQTTRLLDKALDLGHPVRLHADQFNSLGGIPLAIRLAARSVDHLEASTPADLAALGASSTIGVGLPICGLHLDNRYANLRAVLDAGGQVAIATNFNPGSAPSGSMPLAIAAAVRHCGLTPHEAIVASTLGGTAVLGLPDRGRLEVGLPADAVLLGVRDERELAYQLGSPIIRRVFISKDLA